MSADRRLAWDDPVAARVLAALAVDDAPLAWQDKALCGQVDPELFYPKGRGGSTREAKKVCMACEVRAECLEYGQEYSLGFGVFGGLGPQERRRARQAAA